MWPPVKLPTTEDTQEEESIFTVLKGELQPCHYIIRICFEAAMAVMYWSLTFLWAVFHQLGTKPRSGESLPWLSTARCLHRRLHMKIKRKKPHRINMGAGTGVSALGHLPVSLSIIQQLLWYLSFVVELCSWGVFGTTVCSNTRTKCVFFKVKVRNRFFFPGSKIIFANSPSPDLLIAQRQNWVKIWSRAGLRQTAASLTKAICTQQIQYCHCDERTSLTDMHDLCCIFNAGQSSAFLDQNGWTVRDTYLTQSQSSTL